MNIPEKIEILSTNHKKIKLIGEILSNESSRIILELLSDNMMTTSQLAQKTEVTLPVILYHIKKMQDIGLVRVSKIEKNSKEHDMKYYQATKFAIIILPPKISLKAKSSKLLFRSFKSIYKFGAIGISAMGSWFITQYVQDTGVQNNTSGSNIPGSKCCAPGILPSMSIHAIPETLFLSTAITLAVIIAGLVVERILREYKK
ncbi:MAG: winged helix-turn-helix transcriptional regulator [Patescibacteria group bacterium]|nr:winged helix-turn-helix transcriptional regulator [Patescibacteria group bacterium]